MPPTAKIRSLQWAGFHKIRGYPTLHLPQNLDPLNSVDPQTKNIFYPREGPTRFPVTSNAETTMDSPDSSPIPGLTSPLFIVVIVSGVIVLALAIFIPVYCLQRRKRNRLRKGNVLPREEDLELACLGRSDRLRQLYDAPRPDSTTLPIQGVLLANERFLPEVERSSGSPLDDMLKRFNNGSGSISHRRLESDDCERSRITWDNGAGTAISPPPPALSGPSSYYKDYSRSRSTLRPTSPPLAILRSPTIASFGSTSPRVSSVTKGKQPMKHSKPTSKAASKASSTKASSTKASSTRSNKLRKKSRPASERTPPPEPTPPTPMSIFGGFGRTSSGSMSHWVSWYRWDSSGDETDGDSMVGRGKRRK